MLRSSTLPVFHSMLDSLQGMFLIISLQPCLSADQPLQLSHMAPALCMLIPITSQVRSSLPCSTIIIWLRLKTSTLVIKDLHLEPYRWFSHEIHLGLELIDLLNRKLLQRITNLGIDHILLGLELSVLLLVKLSFPH